MSATHAEKMMPQPHRTSSVSAVSLYSTNSATSLPINLPFLVALSSFIETDAR